MRWQIIPLPIVFVALAHFNRISITVAGAGNIIPSGEINEERMGLVYSAFLLLYTIFMIPGGWLVDGRGPRVGWIVVGFGAATGAAITGMAGLFFPGGLALLTSLLIARSLMGACNAPLHPTGARLAANWVPRKNVALANGMITCSACVGIALTYPVFGLLIDHVGWEKAFLITSGVTGVVAVLWLLAGADSPKEVVGPTVSAKPVIEPARVFLALLADHGMICLTLSYAAVGYFQYLFFYWAEYYFKSGLKLSTEKSRLYASLLTLAMGVGMMGGGWLSDMAVRWLGRRAGLAAVPVTGLLLASSMTILAIFTTSATIILASLAVAMAAVGSCEGPSWTASVSIGGRRGATAASILNTGGNGAGMLAPVVTPLIEKRYGWGAALGLASVVCLVGAILWIGVRIPAEAEEPKLVETPLL